MTFPVRVWLQLHFATLWRVFGRKSFSFVKAFEALRVVEESTAKVVLSRLRRAGWVRVVFDQGDHRKRVYTCVGFVTIFDNMKKVGGGVCGKRS